MEWNKWGDDLQVSRMKANRNGSIHGSLEKISYTLGEMKRNKASYFLITPFMLVFFVFTVLPVILSIILSFTYYNVLEFPKWIGWYNYRKLFVDDEVFLKALSNTLVYAVITGPVGFFLSFFAAWAINEVPRRLKGLLTFVFYVPSISGTVYTIWSIIFNADIYGFANSFLIKFGFIHEPIQWFTTEKYILPLIIIVQLWMSMGVGFLAMRAGFASLGNQYYEAAAVDGLKNRWQELWYITIPMMAPHLMTAAVLQITAMFANAQVAHTLAGFPSTNYAGHLIMSHLQDYSSIRMERGYACAISALLFLFMIGINKLVLRFLKKVGV